MVFLIFRQFGLEWYGAHWNTRQARLRTEVRRKNGGTLLAGEIRQVVRLQSKSYGREDVGVLVGDGVGDWGACALKVVAFILSRPEFCAESSAVRRSP